MKAKLIIGAAIGVVIGCGMIISLSPRSATAQARDSSQPAISALRVELDALKQLVPDQAHAMTDVDYHFANLWFAAQSANWPLSAFYLNETRSHLNWAVRIRPVRKLSSGQDLDLRQILQGVEGAGLAELNAAIEKKDVKALEAAYRQTLSECHGCHTAAEKPYLRPHVPEAPASRIIDFKPGAS